MAWYTGGLQPLPYGKDDNGYQKPKVQPEAVKGTGPKLAETTGSLDLWLFHRWLQLCILLAVQYAMQLRNTSP